jgi:hypothetical protein
MLATLCTKARGCLTRHFARTFKKPTTATFKEKFDKRIKIVPETETRNLSEEERLDPNSPEMDDKTLSFMHLKTQLLPEK